MEINEPNGEDEKEVPLKRILLPVDGSPASFRAARYAIKLAKRAGDRNAQITYIHAVVRPPHFSPYTLSPPSIATYIEVTKKDAQKWYEEINAIAAKVGVSIAGEIILYDVESAADSIVNYAAENNVDLIVIGTEGKEGLSKKLQGSVASAVVSNASCSVLVVK